MRINPLNDFIESENDLVKSIKFSGSDGDSPEKTDSKKNKDSAEENQMDINDNIFLFLD